MAQFALGQKATGLYQRADNRAIGVAIFALIIKHALAGKHRNAVEINPAVINRKRHVNIVLHAQFKVILTVARRNMHQPGAGLIGHKITGQHGHIKIITLRGQRVVAGVLLNQELGEPFRRDAMKKPVQVAGVSSVDMAAE